MVGIVRRPDPVPCPACAVGEWDMCRNGQYTEHGIQGLDGFARELWRGQPDAMVKLDSTLAQVGVLLEPTASTTARSCLGSGATIAASLRSPDPTPPT